MNPRRERRQFPPRIDTSDVDEMIDELAPGPRRLELQLRGGFAQHLHEDERSASESFEPPK